jgi:hypothetical protein
MASGSTRTLGYSRRSSGANFQCVVARRPSSNPISASTNAPLQIETTCRARDASDAAASVSVGRTNSCGGSSLPGTITVSNSPASLAAPCTEIRLPREVATSCPSGESSTMS